MLVSVTVTCKHKTEAQKIARSLLKKQLIACAHYWPVDSVYRWQGSIESAKESMLGCTTTRGKVVAVIKEIKKIHSYRVPVITVETITANPEAVSWVKKEII